MKNILLGLIFTFISFQSISQTLKFKSHTVIDEQHSAYNIVSICVGDVDDNGGLDVIGATIQNIFWFKNTQDNAMYDHKEVLSDEIYENQNFIKLSDLDNDGNSDIITISNPTLTNNTLVWARNQGNNTFESPINISDSVSLITPKIIDFDNDGDLDVIFIKTGKHDIVLCENINNKGLFNKTNLIHSNSTLTNFDIQDYNKNNKFDIFTTSNNGNIEWYKNINNTQFMLQPLVSKQESPTKITGQDIDNDGDIDIIVNTATGCYIQKQSSNGLLPPSLINSKRFTSAFIQVLDLDNDGDKDILGKQGWYENINGNFTTEHEIAGYNSIFEKKKIVTTGDLNKDGNIDIILALPNNHVIYWIKNLGNGKFDTKVPFSKDQVNGLKSFLITDIDGDNDLDLLTTSRNDSKVAWYENINGKGQYSPQIIISNTISVATGTVVADIDNDGDKDVFCYSPLGWLENKNGKGLFTNLNTINLPNPIYQIATCDYGDFDGDGDIDFIASQVLDSLVIYKNDGNGHFQKTFPSNSIDGSAVIHAIDIDNDMDLDIILVQEHHTLLLENVNNTGTFNQSTLITEMKDLKISDIDNDGDLDLVVRDLNNNIYWEENIGNGSFVKKPTILSSKFLFYPVDIDLDKDDDLILLDNRYTHKIYWLENKNNIFIGLKEIATIDTYIDELKFADLDHDNDLDLIYSLGDKLAWFENLGFSVGLDKTTNPLKLKISPNPTNGLIKINTPFAISKIEIYNKLGQLVFGNSSQHQINISKLASGLYFCKVTTINGAIGIQKIVKE